MNPANPLRLTVSDFLPYFASSLIAGTPIDFATSASIWSA